MSNTIIRDDYSMAAIAALYFIAASAVVTYALELWTGYAVAGWAGDDALIDRRKRPGPYWAVMMLQTLLLILVPTIVSIYQAK